jgi:F-type H+-transporting ATPase subunit beta
MKGKIVAVKGPIMDVSFEEAGKQPSLGEIITARTIDGKEVTMEVVEHLKGDIARCVSLTMNIGVRRNSEAVSTGSVITMPDSDSCYGRLLNVFGKPLDNLGDVKAKRYNPIKKKRQRRDDEVALEEKREYKIKETGIKMVDLLFPLVVGSKTGILGGAALGKSILTLEVIHNTVKKSAGSCVFTGAGERIREGNELYLEMKQRGLLNRVALVFGQMNESPGTRFEVVFSGITIAESMQEKGEDVLFFLDNVYRFTQAGAELAALMGRIPSETGYQSTLVSEVSEFHERIRSGTVASITAVEAVYVPADDLTDPAVVTIFSHLDSIMVLSRAHMQKGLFPAIDPISSSSAYLSPDIIGDRHFKVANEIKRLFQKFEELQKLVAVIGVDELSKMERVIYDRAQKAQNFLTQPFFVAEEYTGKKGEFVDLEETLSGCEKIISGAADKIAPDDLYMIGALK